MFTQVTNTAMDNLVDDVRLTPEQESLLTGDDYFDIAAEAPFILWNGNTTAMHNGELCFSPYMTLNHPYGGEHTCIFKEVVL